MLKVGQNLLEHLKFLRYLYPLQSWPFQWKKIRPKHCLKNSNPSFIEEGGQQNATNWGGGSAKCNKLRRGISKMQQIESNILRRGISEMQQIRRGFRKMQQLGREFSKMQQIEEGVQQNAINWRTEKVRSNKKKMVRAANLSLSPTLTGNLSLSPTLTGIFLLLLLSNFKFGFSKVKVFVLVSIDQTLTIYQKNLERRQVWYCKFSAASHKN